MGGEDRKAWAREQRQTRIVDIAEAEFFKNGFDATTMDRIAVAAGYTKRTLYIYFKDKEALFLSVAARGLSRLNDMLTVAVAGACGSDARLEALGRAFFRFSLDYPNDADMVMRYEGRYAVYGAAQDSAVDLLPDALRAGCQRLTDANAEVVLSVITEGMAAGTIVSPLVPRQLMLVLWGQIYGVMHILRMRQVGFDAAFGISQETLFVHFLDMMRAALRGAN
ncbi:MAG: TetR/AcrR family transcriptional regulator [Pseudomonadota bacterium]